MNEDEMHIMDRLARDMGIYQEANPIKNICIGMREGNREERFIAMRKA